MINILPYLAIRVSGHAFEQHFRLQAQHNGQAVGRRKTHQTQSLQSGSGKSADPKASNRCLDLWQGVVGFSFLHESNYMESINSIQVPDLFPPSTKLLPIFVANGYLLANPVGKEFRS